jgi:hypothetical protein
MESDFIKGEDGFFRVDLPSPGTHEVTLTLGDLGGWPGRQAISINGVFQETVSTGGGELVAVSYEVQAPSGYVTVGLRRRFRASRFTGWRSRRPGRPRRK